MLPMLLEVPVLTHSNEKLLGGHASETLWLQPESRVLSDEAKLFVAHSVEPGHHECFPKRAWEHGVSSA